MRDIGPIGPEDYGHIEEMLSPERLVPRKGQAIYSRFDGHELLVCGAALGDRADGIHAGIYAEIKNSQRKRGGSPRQYPISHWTAKWNKSWRTIQRHIDDMVSAELLMSLPLKWDMSSVDGKLYSIAGWEDGNCGRKNSFEQQAYRWEAHVRGVPRELLDEKGRMIEAGESTVAGLYMSDISRDDMAKVEGLLAQIRAILGGDSTASEHDDSLRNPEPPESDGHGYEKVESAPVKSADDAAAADELPGYIELAKLDRRADKGKQAYQADAQAAYRNLLDDPFGPALEEIAEAYQAYDEELVRDGREKMRRPLARWLMADDAYGAREGIRALRHAKQAAPPRRRGLCPHCGHEAEYLSGHVFTCRNPDCDFHDEMVTVTEYIDDGEGDDHGK